MQRILFVLVGALVLGAAPGPRSSADESVASTSLGTLVAEDRLGELEQRIRAGVPPEAGLMAAVRHDSADALRLVLELGADPKGRQASRALMRAKRQGLDRVARVLTQAGANLEGRDPDGRTLLILAVQETDVGRVRHLLTEGADVNARSNVGTTVLMEAVATQRRRNLKALLDSGAEIEAEDRDGWTALEWAVRLENVEAVRLLLLRGANPDHVDRLGWTPLLLASVQANPVVVHELLARGASPNLRTPAVGTALIRGVYGANREVIRQLLAYGADRRPGFGGRTAFEWARALGRTELTGLLVVGERRP